MKPNIITTSGIYLKQCLEENSQPQYFYQLKWKQMTMRFKKKNTE